MLPWVTSSWDRSYTLLSSPLPMSLLILCVLFHFLLKAHTSLLLASRQGVTWQYCLRASRGISLSPGTQTLVLGTMEQERKLGATGSSLPHTPGLPPGNRTACTNSPRLSWSTVSIGEEGRFVLCLGFATQ